MRAVVQRVSQAEVQINHESVGAIGRGLLVFVGVHQQDNEADVVWMVDKIRHLRIFKDDQGLMNRSLMDTCGEILVVSQFTLYGDCRKGRRPSWNGAAPSELARQLYDLFVELCRQRQLPVQTGIFQADMQVSLINDGPVTLLLDSHKTF